VPQELPSWYGNLRHQLQYEAAIHGIKGKDNLLQVDCIIERLGLQSHIDKKWQELSGGFKFRFALAKALVWQPDMMILDEPLANLDMNAQLSILRDIKHLATSVSNPIAVFISSQHLYEIEAISDNLLFLRDGKALFNSPMQNLGVGHTENIFEIGAAINYEKFVNLFSESITVSIKHDGLQYIVTTPLSFGKNELLKILLANDIDLRYFRDISCSSKKFFMRGA
jgi:ABC-2 type transport system ATP-binding protein